MFQLSADLMTSPRPSVNSRCSHARGFVWVVKAVLVIFIFKTFQTKTFLSGLLSVSCQCPSTLYTVHL